ncbi:MFS transporter [Aromatoleum aromaticum]|jgi:PAT family beta-lactamase induction signal transducer AmpG|uniref:MFS transporter n=1 Tax=Aromatoleum aromaticum TaxID=551760 RepID=UPI001459CD19|nr:MFS transporter [Aromatoleum aromaticum]NMG55053.1 MFS transporter [Aromatoleum aromaticum]
MSAALSHVRVRHVLFGWINFALTAPAIYLWLGLPLVMRQQGWSGAEIGLFQLAGLPAVFKLFLALPIERWRAGRRPYRRWAWLTGGGYLLALLSLAALGADAHKGILFALILLAALCATWADIPVNALAIKLFPAEERPRAGGVRSAATFAGAIVGGGAMLLLQQALGWAVPFLLLGACLLVALGLLGCIEEDGSVSGSHRSTPLAVWLGFFRQAGAGIWTVVLLGYFPFVAAAWVYLKPLLLDRGFPASEVAWIAGVGGGALGALASFGAGLVPRVLILRVLPLSAGANALALALLAAAAGYGTPAGLVAAAAFLAVAMGVASALAFALMMEFARDGWRAADYGLQASLFTLGRIAVAPPAGLLLDRLGYPGMLAALAAASLAVALLIAARRRLGLSLVGVSP